MNFIRLTINKEERLINLGHVQEFLPQNESDGVKARILYAGGEIQPVEESFGQIIHKLDSRDIIVH